MKWAKRKIVDKKNESHDTTEVGKTNLENQQSLIQNLFTSELDNKISTFGYELISFLKQVHFFPPVSESNHENNQTNHPTSPNFYTPCVAWLAN
jgi:hypothetical protein